MPRQNAADIGCWGSAARRWQASIASLHRSLVNCSFMTTKLGSAEDHPDAVGDHQGEVVCASPPNKRATARVGIIFALEANHRRQREHRSANDPPGKPLSEQPRASSRNSLIYKRLSGAISATY